MIGVTVGRVSAPAARLQSTAGARRRSEAAPGPLGGWVSAALIALLLVVASTPLAAQENAASVAVAVILSLSGVLSLRYPVLGASLIGVVMTMTFPGRDIHIGTGALASPIAVVALAARGHLPAALAMAAWHVIPITAVSVLRGDEGQHIVAQLMHWLALQGAAVLGGTWGRSLVLRAGAERARRFSDLAEQRRAIARELHDSGVRAMTQVVMLAENGARRPRPVTTGNADLTRISATARQATEEMRMLLEMLRARDEQAGGPIEPALHLPHPIPARSGQDAFPPSLAAALEATRLRLAADGFTVRTGLEGADQLSRSTLTLLTRCLAEIEANVLLHGDRGTPVTLLAEITEAVELVVLNGVAEDPLRLQGGSGLAGMSERLVAAGGTVEAGQEGRIFLTHIEIPGERAAE